ncbi:hypothetical protein ACIBJF_52105 [Streptomyces sp. NPDC050743]|uniref:hypothetical protein n=1 Tax=Streptomyces sp. NPDC050743 TaxID=3365634 RepID=UPI0037884900
MGIHLYAMNQSGDSLHLHPGCDAVGDASHDAPDHLTFNHPGEAYAAMRALRSAHRFDEMKRRYVRDRIHMFKLTGVPGTRKLFGTEDITRHQVETLPVCRSAPDHPDYALWRAGVLEAAPRGEKSVTEAGLLSPELAHAIGIKGVHLWDPDRTAVAPDPEQVQDTTAEQLINGQEPV